MKKQLLVLFTLLALIGFSQSGQACQASFTWVADSSGGVQFTNTSTGVFGGNAQWSFGDGTSSTQQNPFHQYNANSFWMVCLTMWDSSGCQSTYCDTISTGGSTGGCQASFTPTVNGNTVQFSNTSFGNYSGLLWSYGDGTSGTSPSHTYTTAGVYNVCLNIGTNPASACSDTYCATIVIQGASNCNAQFTSVDTAGGTFFIPAVYQAGWNYYWTFGDGSSSTDPYPFHTYNANGIYGVCLTVIDSGQNCITTWCDSIIVGTPPSGCQASFGYQQGSGSVYFYGSSATPGTTFTSWLWNFGDGTTATGQNPIHAYAANGTYQVCMVASNFLCTDTVCGTITVTNSGGSACNANFSVYDSAGVHYFIPNVVASNINYFWDFGDNTSSTSSIGIHQYNGTGLYYACLTVTDSSLGCTATTCDTVVVGGTPAPCQAYFSYSTDSLGNVQFYNASTGNYSNVQWSFGDGTSSTQINPTHAYSGTGPYYVCLIIFGNASPALACQSSFCDTIYPGLNANSCVPVFYTFPDSSSFGNGNMNFGLINSCANTTYVWSFGDGTTVTTTSAAPAPVHQYPATGWYNVCVTATTPTNTYNYCNQVYAFRGATGLNSIDRLDASVYPNPASLTATLRFVAGGETLLDVVTLQGRLVSTQNAGTLSGEVQLPLDISTLENGIYFVRLQSGSLSGTVKILVQH